MIADCVTSSRISQCFCSTPLHKLHHVFAITILFTPSYATVLCPQITDKSSQVIYFFAHVGYFFNPIDHAPKSFFKSLFLGTCLGSLSIRMSHAEVAPERLKPQECKRNDGRSKPFIPYIPEKDDLQEAVDSSANTMKLLLPHKVELLVPVW